MLDAKAIAQSTALIVKEHVAAATKPLLERIEQLEKRPAPASLTSDVVMLMIDEKIAAIPPAEPGRDADLEQVASMVAEAVERAVEALPKPQDGKSVEIAELEPLIGELVAKAVAAIPPAQPGKDGVGISDSLIGRDGGLVLTLTDGRTLNPGTVVGKDVDPAQIAAMVKEAVDAIPRPRDGFSLDDFDIAPMPDGRTIEMSFTAADGTKHTYELQFPVAIYRGVYRDSEQYQHGDTVTWGGSLWHCERATTEKPGTADWVLAVKKGRDGKDAKPA